MPCLGSFELKFKKAIVIFEISTLKFVKNVSLTHTVNFGIGSTFLKVRGQPFRKAWGRGRFRFTKCAENNNANEN